jgi:NAD(P)-dependent dehydrogenase (short-subunit alcohol dehydrogenase family)
MSDSRFLIFGATGGIGSELCGLLTSQGHQVLRVAKQNQDSDYQADVTDPEAVTKIFQSATEAGSLSGVALCVGSILLKPAHLLSDDDWAKTMSLNLTAAFHIVRGCAKHMRENGGSVVLFSSVAARVGLANHEAIAAAKAGIIGLAQSAAATYASNRLRFNVIAPGLTRTPLASRLTSNEASLKASEAMHPLGRIGDAAEVARMAAFLLDPGNSWITGQVFGIDGGLSTLKPPSRST